VTAVVCRGLTQFRDWCRDKGRDPRDPTLRMVTDERHVRGYVFADVIAVGGPWHLREAARCRVSPTRPIPEWPDSLLS
jgi:hypothetical protein